MSAILTSSSTGTSSSYAVCHLCGRLGCLSLGVPKISAVVMEVELHGGLWESAQVVSLRLRPGSHKKVTSVTGKGICLD